MFADAINLAYHACTRVRYDFVGGAGQKQNRFPHLFSTNGTVTWAYRARGAKADTLLVAASFTVALFSTKTSILV